MPKQRRVVTLTKITRTPSGEYWVKAFDQMGRRFEVADYFTDDLVDARETGRAMVNESRGANREAEAVEERAAERYLSRLEGATQ